MRLLVGDCRHHNCRHHSEYGELEPEKMSTVEPMIISTSSFRETIANEWKQCAEYKMVRKTRQSDRESFSNLAASLFLTKGYQRIQRKINS